MPVLQRRDGGAGAIGEGMAALGGPGAHSKLDALDPQRDSAA